MGHVKDFMPSSKSNEKPLDDVNPENDVRRTAFKAFNHDSSGGNEQKRGLSMRTTKIT